MTRLLHKTTYGEPGKQPLLIVHGLFGSGRNWRALARRLAARRQVVCVDMRNHGDSFRDPRMDYPAMAGDLAAVIDDLGGTADVLGHSMGGKAAMTLAVTRPDCVHSLTVADIAPTAYSHSQLPAIEAMRALDLTGLTRRSEVQALLEQATGDRALGAFLSQSADLGANPPRWTLNLDALAAGMDDIIGFPALIGRYEGPVFFLTGARSDYVGARDAPAIGRLFGRVHYKALEDAGHWLHADQPKAFIAAVERFLDRL